MSAVKKRTLEGDAGAVKPVKRARADYVKKPAATGGQFSKDKNSGDNKTFKLAASSAEAHATQRALAKERKANKPNADIVARSKKIWERLRLKSHLEKNERQELVEELYAIINGRVRDFVFKHDSVRVIQCALKYANKEQRFNITKELQSDMRDLVESKYGKFMVAKILVEGDQEVRNMVIPEFYGHIRRFINHPEAAWIIDDIYRGVATAEQKAHMLREWYGPEFALENKIKDAALKSTKTPTADLAQLLKENPEKRKPIMNHLQQLINQLVQKKMSGFTMLHDAMLQYFLNLPAGSSEANEFLENLKSDLDGESGGGDLLKNLAFTKSGSRVVALALAYGTAKDRKLILRVYRDVVEAMVFDAHAFRVLLAALEVTDDTKASAKAIYTELLSESVTDETDRADRLLAKLNHPTARIPLLYPLAGDAKWLIPADVAQLLAEVHAIRATAGTSKKAPATRHAELARHVAPALLAHVALHAGALVQQNNGCQAVAEILLSCAPLAPTSEDVAAAVKSVAEQCGGDPSGEGHISQSASAGKMLKPLCQGGRYDPAIKTVVKVESGNELGFASALWAVVGEEHVVGWATGPSSFVVVAMVEGGLLGGAEKKALLGALRNGKEKLTAAAGGKDGEGAKGNAGSRLLLGLL